MVNTNSINFVFVFMVVSLCICEATVKCFQCYRLHDIIIDNDRRECQDPFTGDGVHTFECDIACTKDSTIFANGTKIVNRRGCKELGTKCECDEEDKSEDRRCCLECSDVNLCNTSSALINIDIVRILFTLPLIKLLLK